MRSPAHTCSCRYRLHRRVLQQLSSQCQYMCCRAEVRCWRMSCSWAKRCTSTCTSNTHLTAHSARQVNFCQQPDELQPCPAPGMAATVASRPAAGQSHRASMLCCFVRPAIDCMGLCRCRAQARRCRPHVRLAEEGPQPGAHTRHVRARPVQRPSAARSSHARTGLPRLRDAVDGAQRLRL